MEKKQKELLIIMPAYNEAGNIENVLDNLKHLKLLVLLICLL